MFNYTFKEFLEDKGYFFDDNLIENFLLSLKTKPFVILSGNSNVDKIKLPQLFAEYTNFYQKEYYMIKVSTLKRSHSGGKDKKVGWGIYKKYIKNILPVDKINGKYEVEIGGISTQADILLSVQLYYDYNAIEVRNFFKKLHDKELLKKSECKGNKNKPKQQMVYLGVSRESLINLISADYINKDEINLYPSLPNPVTRGRMVPFVIFDHMPFNKKMPCRIVVNGMVVDANFELKVRIRNYAVGEIKNYLNSLQGKESRFELKLKGFEHDFDEFKSFISNSPKNNYEIISEEYNERSHILGYSDSMDNEYQDSILEIIKKAESDPNNPYFLILDGIKSSTIENYLSDFLSAIEKDQKIHLNGNDSFKIPNNVFIIGIVNDVECKSNSSSQGFDRANVIELDSFASENNKYSQYDFKENNIYLTYPLMDCDISLFDVNDFQECLSNIIISEENLWNVLSEELSKLQKILIGSGFEFNYWVIDEILRFMVVSWKYENFPKEWKNWERYFDAQIKQKILPKISGNHENMDLILINLFKACLKDDCQDIDFNSIHKDECKYYTSALKLQSMYQEFLDDEHVSFIS